MKTNLFKDDGFEDIYQGEVAPQCQCSLCRRKRMVNAFWPAVVIPPIMLIIYFVLTHFYP